MIADHMIEVVSGMGTVPQSQVKSSCLLNMKLINLLSHCIPVLKCQYAVYIAQQNLKYSLQTRFQISNFPSWSKYKIYFGLSSTLSMFYKGQSIWDGRQNFEKNKGQDLALSHIARDVFGKWKFGHGKGRQARFVAARDCYFILFTHQVQNKA